MNFQCGSRSERKGVVVPVNNFLCIKQPIFINKRV